MGVAKYLWNDITDAVVMEKDGAGNTTAVYQSDPDAADGWHSLCNV